MRDEDSCAQFDLNDPAHNSVGGCDIKVEYRYVVPVLKCRHVALAGRVNVWWMGQVVLPNAPPDQSSRTRFDLLGILNFSQTSNHHVQTLFDYDQPNLTISGSAPSGSRRLHSRNFLRALVTTNLIAPNYGLYETPWSCICLRLSP